MQLTTTLTDFLPKELIPPSVWRGLAGLVAVVCLLAVGMKLHSALKTGITQRLTDTPQYSRESNPSMFWSLVALYIAIALGLLACLTVEAWRLIYGGTF